MHFARPSNMPIGSIRCDGSVLERTAGSAVICTVENGKGKAAEAGNGGSYYTTASKKGRVRYNQLSWTIGVGESDGYPMPVGQANQVDKTGDGLALWRLTVHGAGVPARFVIIDGRFVEIEPGSG